MELEGAIESLENLKILFEIEDERDFEATPKHQRIIAQQIEVVLNHLTKQEKMIELLIKHICDVIDNDDGACLLPFYNSDENLEEKVKQYFEKKAEESE